ncbi:MAG: hypothetical protein EOO04_33695, partial [Chitinophagaceae bacterium]
MKIKSTAGLLSAVCIACLVLYSCNDDAGDASGSATGNDTIANGKSDSGQTGQYVSQPLVKDIFTADPSA